VANQLELTRSDPYKSDREMTVCELQNEVARYEAEFTKARTDLRDALLAATREALNGVAAKPPDISAMTLLNVTPGAPAPRSPNASLGRVYCDATRRSKGAATKAAALLVPSLYAATMHDQGGAPPPATVSPVTQAPVPTPAGVVQGDTVLSRIAPAPTPGVLYQAPVVLSGSVDNARIRMRDNQRLVNTNAVELHKKFAISVACTIFVLVGAPIALRFPRGGVGLVIGVSLVIFGIYYIGLIAGEALADKNLLPPFLAMWAANILLTIVGIFLLARMGRESATTRGGDLREMLDIFRNTFRRERQPRLQHSEAR
jgi:lipopolysaccharide export system permease protein